MARRHATYGSLGWPAPHVRRFGKGWPACAPHKRANRLSVRQIRPRHTTGAGSSRTPKRIHTNPKCRVTSSASSPSQSDSSAMEGPESYGYLYMLAPAPPPGSALQSWEATSSHSYESLSEGYQSSSPEPNKCKTRVTPFVLKKRRLAANARERRRMQNLNQVNKTTLLDQIICFQNFELPRNNPVTIKFLI